MKDIDYKQATFDSMDRITKGAFLTVKSGDDLNTMTIGWATIGFVWRKPIMMVAVRQSRHTFGIIEKADDFTVTIPLADMKKEIAFCGTQSGRDQNKFGACNLETAQSRHAVSPVIKACGRHYECKIIFKSAMDPVFLDNDYNTGLYADRDYHTLYFGEIMACYETD